MILQFTDTVLSGFISVERVTQSSLTPNFSAKFRFNALAKAFTFLGADSFVLEVVFIVRVKSCFNIVVN